MRLRKIRSTLNFSNILGVGLSNYHSLVSLHSGQDASPSIHSQLTLSSVKSGEDEYVTGIRNILESSIRDPRTREGTLAKCSGLASGELSCKLCYTRDNNLTASQIFWQHDVKFTLPPEIFQTKLTVAVDSDEEDEGEKIGFVQHLSSTKRFNLNVTEIIFVFYFSKS